jgi:hypothetical protein
MCSSTVEWKQKMWYIPITACCSAIMNNEIMSFAGKWMEMEDIMLAK